MRINEVWHERCILALSYGAWIFCRLFGSLKVVGRENIPMKGAAIIASNHTSVSDPVGIWAVSPRVFHYMATSELFSIPILNKIITFLQAFPVRRGENDVRAIAHARKLLKAGEAIVIYPEGRITSDGYLGPLLNGTVLLALRSKCPIVPVVMIGFDKMLPKGGKMMHFAKKEVRFGSPLHFDIPEGPITKEHICEASSQLRKALLSLGAREKSIEN